MKDSKHFADISLKKKELKIRNLDTYLKIVLSNIEKRANSGDRYLRMSDMYGGTLFSCLLGPNPETHEAVVKKLQELGFEFGGSVTEEYDFRTITW